MNLIKVKMCFLLRMSKFIPNFPQHMQIMMRIPINFATGKRNVNLRREV